jgi:hypothetical protein
MATPGGLLTQSSIAAVPRGIQQRMQPGSLIRWTMDPYLHWRRPTQPHGLINRRVSRLGGRKVLRDT